MKKMTKRIACMAMGVVVALGLTACGADHVASESVSETLIRADVQEYLENVVGIDAQVDGISQSQSSNGGTEQLVTGNAAYTADGRDSTMDFTMTYVLEDGAWVLNGMEAELGKAPAAPKEEPDTAVKEQPDTNIVAEGKCTDTISWSMTKDKVLTLSGTGSLGSWSVRHEANLPLTPEVVVIGEGISEIDTYSFESVDTLKEFRVADGNSVFKAVDGILYQGNTLLLCPTGYNKVINVPDGVLEVDKYAFSWNKEHTLLKGISLPNTIQMLPTDALMHFDYNKIQIEEGGVYQMQDGCLYAKTVYAANEGFELVRCFSNPNGIFTVPAGVTTIGDHAFNFCDRLIEVRLPDSLSAIKNGAFMNCSKLGKINIPAGVYMIGESAFDACYNLSYVTVSENNLFYFAKDGILYEGMPGGGTYYVVTDFGEHDTIKIIDGTVTIRENAISDHKATTIELPASLNTIEENGVYCMSLNTIYYRGTQEQWKNVRIAERNDYLVDCTIHSNYAG